MIAQDKEIFDIKTLSKHGIKLNRGTVKTYNRTGYMRNFLCELSKQFCSQPFIEKYSILEIGCGIGAVLKTLIDRGGKNITGVDAEKKHQKIILLLLKETLSSRPEVNLQLVHDSLPHLDKLKGRLFDTILCAQVLHYMTPDSFEIAINNLYNLLKRNGTLYITVGSPKLKSYKGFLEVYESKLLQNERYPGYMEDTSLYNPQGVNYNKGSFLFFGPQDLRARMKEFGFNVLEVKYIPEADQKEGQTAIICNKH